MAHHLSALPTKQLARVLRAQLLAHHHAPAAAALRTLRAPHAAQHRAFFSSWWFQRRPGKPNEGPDADSAAEAARRSAGNTPQRDGEGGGSASSHAGAGQGSPPGEGDGGAGRIPGNGEGGGDEDSTNAITVVPVHPTGLRRDNGPLEPRLVVMPLSRRPLFPGQMQVVHVTNEAVIKELEKLSMRNMPLFVAAFLHKGTASGAAAAAGGSAPAGEGEKDAELPPQLEDFSKSDPLEVLYQVGTRARIAQAAPFRYAAPGKNELMQGLEVVLHGHELIKLEKVLSKGPPLQVQAAKIEYPKSEDGGIIQAYTNELLHTLREIMKISPQFREHAVLVDTGLQRLERTNAHGIAHFAISLTTATGAELMEVLETEDAAEKLRLALVIVKKELELSQLQHKIAQQIEEKVTTQQREFLLREQMKMIKKELGEDKSDGTDKLVDKFKKRLESKTVPKDAQEAITSELEKFSNLVKESQEYQMTRNYLDWLTCLPWGHYSTDTLNLKKAKEILDRDHYGLNEVKERILEHIAVGCLRGSVQGKILCFVGPPGVGKTSIGRSIAEALGREFYRFSVGGLYDVAEIKGHRRTYVGAMPGKIVQCLKKVQTSNPLLLIDEVDKIGRGHQGDPSSALLELLDPSQNSSFLDHYLDVPVDCSRVLFVCTANVTDTIPGPLLDRMEVIRLSGYDLQEKVKIAENYLVPTSMREVGLWPPDPLREQKEKGDAASTEAAAEASVELVKPKALTGSEADAGAGPAVVPPPAEVAPTSAAALGHLPQASIDPGAVEALIRWYCREAGVRNLQKHIEKVCRKLATKVVEHREAQKQSAEAVESGQVAPEDSGLDLVVTEDKLKDFVGKPVFISDRLYEGRLPEGTVTGLAWTALGGSVLYVEATALPRLGGNKGSPTLNVTGQLGSVMKESSQIALINARRLASSCIPEARANFYEEHDLYVHCPEGATPKDGPSAGVTMTTALLSLGLGRPVRDDLAMTGEISLNGKVLAVGGIKEKTIAARRAGCKALVFPQANRRDFEELPEYLREGLEVHYATKYEEVFRVAFPEDPEEKLPPAQAS